MKTLVMTLLCCLFLTPQSRADEVTKIQENLTKFRTELEAKSKKEIDGKMAQMLQNTLTSSLVTVVDDGKGQKVFNIERIKAALQLGARLDRCTFYKEFNPNLKTHWYAFAKYTDGVTIDPVSTVIIQSKEASNSVELLQFLLDQGLSLSTSFKNINQLMFAYREYNNGHNVSDEVIEFLIDTKKINLDEYEVNLGESVLGMALRAGRIDHAKRMIANGANPLLAFAYQTSLILPASQNVNDDPAVLDYAISLIGEERSKPDMSKAFIKAIQSKNVNVAKVLYEKYHQDPNPEISNYDTISSPLHLANEKLNNCKGAKECAEAQKIVVFLVSIGAKDFSRKK